MAVQPLTTDRPTTQVRPAVRLVNLCKSYPAGDQSVHAVNHVSLEASPGERLAIIGRSGSGKSTLLNLIGGLETPTAGEICIAGTNLGALSDDDLTRFRREHIGVVFQFFNLLPTLTVRENVALPGRLAGMPRPDAFARADALLAAVEMTPRADARPHTLSGGERQRTALARALLHEPDLLLADEPTGNLDTRAANQVLELIYGLAAERGATILLVTHSREAAERAGRILEMHDGRLQAHQE